MSRLFVVLLLLVCGHTTARQTSRHGGLRHKVRAMFDKSLEEHDEWTLGDMARACNGGSSSAQAALVQFYNQDGTVMNTPGKVDTYKEKQSSKVKHHSERTMLLDGQLAHYWKNGATKVRLFSTNSPCSVHHGTDEESMFCFVGGCGVSVHSCFEGIFELASLFSGEPRIQFEIGFSNFFNKQNKGGGIVGNAESMLDSFEEWKRSFGAFPDNLEYYYLMTEEPKNTQTQRNMAYNKLQPAMTPVDTQDEQVGENPPWKAYSLDLDELAKAGEQQWLANLLSEELKAVERSKKRVQLSPEDQLKEDQQDQQEMEKRARQTMEDQKATEKLEFRKAMAEREKEVTLRIVTAEFHVELEKKRQALIQTWRKKNPEEVSVDQTKMSDSD